MPDHWPTMIIAQDNPLEWVGKYWYLVLLVGAWLVAQLRTRKSKEAEKRQQEVREILRRQAQTEQPQAPPARRMGEPTVRPLRPTPPRRPSVPRPVPPRPAAPARPQPIAAPTLARGPSPPRPVARRPEPPPPARPPTPVPPGEQVLCPRCGSRMVPRGQIDDATVYMCSRFPLCPTISRVERVLEAVPPVRPARPVPPKPKAKPKPPRPRVKPEPARVPRPAPVAPARREPIKPAEVPALGMLLRSQLAGNPAALRRAIVLAEILAPPLATRERTGSPF